MVSLADLRSRLYKAYAAQHAGCGGDEAAALVYRRDIRPLLLPPAVGPVVDLGCGYGDLVRLMQVDGFDAEGKDISAEQAALARAAGVARVRQGDFRTAETGELRGHIATRNLTFAARISSYAQYVLDCRRVLSGPNVETL